MTAERPDLEARIGWLLATTRLHTSNDFARDGRGFTAALAEVDVAASRSLVSRWESGEIAISYEALFGYEQVLGLPEGMLTSTVGYLRSALPGVRERLVRPRLEPETSAFADRLDQLLTLAEDGNATPGEWQELGWHMSLVPLVHLRGGVWEGLTRQLIGQLPRSVETAFRQLSTGMINISRVPRAQPHLLNAITAYLRDPHAQVLGNPLGELDLFDSRHAAAVLFEVLESPRDEETFRTAVWTATQKVRKGQFTEVELSRLELLVLARWRDNARQAADQLVELIAVLPDGVRDQLTRAAAQIGRKRLGYAIEHGEVIPAARAREFAEHIASAAKAELAGPAAYGRDKMLPRLIREGLFHRNSESRYHACWLLGTSPFRGAVESQLLDLLGSAEVPAAFRTSIALMAKYLYTEERRQQRMRLLADRQDSVAVPMARSIGHLPFAPISDRALRTRLEADAGASSRAALYALGMTASPALTELAESAEKPWQRDGAGWWLREGPAVRAVSSVGR